jgi:hypothetical protein
VFCNGNPLVLHWVALIRVLLGFLICDVSLYLFCCSDASNNNPCSVNNGGCSELCLFNGTAAVCQCSHRRKVNETHCIGSVLVVLTLYFFHTHYISASHWSCEHFMPFFTFFTWYMFGCWCRFQLILDFKKNLNWHQQSDRLVV